MRVGERCGPWLRLGKRMRRGFREHLVHLSCFMVENTVVLKLLAEVTDVPAAAGQPGVELRARVLCHLLSPLRLSSHLSLWGSEESY